MPWYEPLLFLLLSLLDVLLPVADFLFVLLLVLSPSSIINFGRSKGEMKVGKLLLREIELVDEDGSLITSAARRERS
jgi:hypothetical protein